MTFEARKCGREFLNRCIQDGKPSPDNSVMTRKIESLVKDARVNKGNGPDGSALRW